MNMTEQRVVACLRTLRCKECVNGEGTNCESDDDDTKTGQPSQDRI